MSGIERSRRRGSTLEAAILDAAWAELLEHGFAGLTMDGAAKRAGTSRPVLARRWTGKAELAAAAIRNYNQQNALDVPDLGSIRAELVELFQGLSSRGATTMAKTLLTLADIEEIAGGVGDLLSRDTCDGALETVLRRAVHRGEVSEEKITSRVMTLPLDLLRYETIMTGKPVSRKSIEEIIDMVFLPLVVRKTES